MNLLILAQEEHLKAVDRWVEQMIEHVDRLMYPPKTDTRCQFITAYDDRYEDRCLRKDTIDCFDCGAPVCDQHDKVCPKCGVILCDGVCYHLHQDQQHKQSIARA